jgi:transposase
MKPFKLVAVALANKMARIAWAVMARNKNYQPDFIPSNSVPVPA